jgi:hypothetical protein
MALYSAPARNSEKGCCGSSTGTACARSFFRRSSPPFARFGQQKRLGKPIRTAFLDDLHPPRTTQASVVLTSLILLQFWWASSTRGPLTTAANRLELLYFSMGYPKILTEPLGGKAADYDKNSSRERQAGHRARSDPADPESHACRARPGFSTSASILGNRKDGGTVIGMERCRLTCTRAPTEEARCQIATSQGTIQLGFLGHRIGLCRVDARSRCLRLSRHTHHTDVVLDHACCDHRAEHYRGRAEHHGGCGPCSDACARALPLKGRSCSRSNQSRRRGPPRNTDATGAATGGGPTG